MAQSNGSEANRLIKEALEEAEDQGRDFGVEFLESVSDWIATHGDCTESQLASVRKTHAAIMVMAECRLRGARIEEQDIQLAAGYKRVEEQDRELLTLKYERDLLQADLDRDTPAYTKALEEDLQVHVHACESKDRELVALRTEILNGTRQIVRVIRESAALRSERDALLDRVRALLYSHWNHNPDARHEPTHGTVGCIAVMMSELRDLAPPHPEPETPSETPEKCPRCHETPGLHVAGYCR